MTHAFKRYLSWPNNKHYPVMYSVLFYQCWQCETCERTQGAAAAMCGRRHLGCYINFNYFHGTCVVLFFVVWSWPFWPYEFCAWPGWFFYDDWAIYFWLLPLIFSWTFFFKITLLYSSLFNFPTIRLPSVHSLLSFESRSWRCVQHYVIKFVSDLRHVGGFIRVLLFSAPIILIATV